MGDSYVSDSASGDAGQTGASDGTLFRRYRVQRELGRGGMGVVVLADDTVLGVPVAVKLVPDPVVHDEDSINDLRREVLRGIALTHPSIVRTHTFERDSSGAGIVMEYIDGDSLGSLKNKQPNGCFQPEQILPWVEQLCAALDYAHREARIVHRDLKPRNVMLTSTGRVKVVDFGIAAALGDSMSRHSMEGKLSGTLNYMSPQQASGARPSPLDDIYALGATIFELLTGKPPFFRGNQTAIHSQIMNVMPPTIAARREELELSAPGHVPKHWEKTVADCLSKRPEARPQTATEVFLRLSGAAVVRPMSKTSTTLMWTGLGLFAAAVTGGVVYVATAPSAPHPASRPASVEAETPSPATPHPIATITPAPVVTPTPPPATPVPVATPTPTVTPSPTPAVAMVEPPAAPSPASTPRLSQPTPPASLPSPPVAMASPPAPLMAQPTVAPPTPAPQPSLDQRFAPLVGAFDGWLPSLGRPVMHSPATEVRAMREELAILLPSAPPARKPSLDTAVRLCDAILGAIEGRKAAEKRLADSRSKPGTILSGRSNNAFFDNQIRSNWDGQRASYQQSIAQLYGRLRALEQAQH